MALVKGMIHRHSPKDELDFFPTPPWATRALFEHVITFRHADSVIEPACGAGHMGFTIAEYMSPVIMSDVHDYGIGTLVFDYLETPFKSEWVITNPPFNKAVDFTLKALREATKGVAMLCRTQWIEGKKRYEQLFRDHPPTLFAPFVERVPMVKGRWDPNATTPMSYSWFVWQKPLYQQTRVQWIPPCRKDLTKPIDFERWNSN